MGSTCEQNYRIFCNLNAVILEAVKLCSNKILQSLMGCYLTQVDLRNGRKMVHIEGYRYSEVPPYPSSDSRGPCNWQHLCSEQL